MKKAIVFASILTLAGCSGMPTSNSNSVDATADCITEVLRLEALPSGNGGDMMSAFLLTQPNVVRTFVRAAQVQQVLPESWQEQFETVVESQYAEYFIMACAENNATVEVAAQNAALMTDHWLVSFVADLKAKIQEKQSQQRL